MSLHNKKLEAFLSVSVEVWKRIQNQILIWQKFSLFFMFSAITAKSTTTLKKKYVSKGPDSGKSESLTALVNLLIIPFMQHLTYKSTFPLYI